MTISRIHRCFKHISLYALVLVPAMVYCMEQPQQTTSIFDAINRGELSAVARLVAESADPGSIVNSTNSQGETPLCSAAFYNNLPIARLLLDHGAAATINQPDQADRTPLYWAAYHNNLSMVRLFLEHVATANINQLGLGGCTPLHLAAYSNNHDIVRLLLAHGAAASVNQRDQYNHTPLHWAAYHNNLAMLHALLAYPKINFALKDPDGRTAEEYAREKGYMEIADLIHIAHQQQDALSACALAFACAMHPRVGADSPAHGLTQYILQDVFQLLQQYKMYQPEDDPSQAASSNVPARNWTHYCSIQ